MRVERIFKLISVALATYNGEKYVEKQVRSILDQTIPPDEIIISDDNSQDRTLKIIEKLGDPRIKLIKNNDNIGYTQNFKQAISSTKGDWIFLADQDDIWLPNKVEKMMTVIKSNKCDLLCSNFSLIDKNGEEISKTENFFINSYVRKAKAGVNKVTFSRVVLGNVLQGCTYCFSKEVGNKFLEINNSDVIHDWQLMLIASYMGNVLFYNEPLIKYRLHDANSVGIGKKGDHLNIDFKKPKTRPTMVSFFEDFGEHVKVPFIKMFIIKLAYYLRIPYAVAAFHIPI